MKLLESVPHGFSRKAMVRLKTILVEYPRLMMLWQDGVSDQDAGNSMLEDVPSVPEDDLPSQAFVPSPLIDLGAGVPSPLIDLGPAVPPIASSTVEEQSQSIPQPVEPSTQSVSEDETPDTSDPHVTDYLEANFNRSRLDVARWQSKTCMYGTAYKYCLVIRSFQSICASLGIAGFGPFTTVTREHLEGEAITLDRVVVAKWLGVPYSTLQKFSTNVEKMKTALQSIENITRANQHLTVSQQTLQRKLSSMLDESQTLPSPSTSTDQHDASKIKIAKLMQEISSSLPAGAAQTRTFQY